MKNWKLNNFLAIFGGFLLLILTFFRENLLLTINALIKSEVYNRAYSYWFSEFFKKVPFEYLKIWKWGLTISFSILMTIITLASLYSWFKSKQHLKFLILLYFGVFIGLFLIGSISFLLNSFDTVYFVLRRVLGVVQSPIPFFGFFILFYSLKMKD
jgi:hypothetical protein